MLATGVQCKKMYNMVTNSVQIRFIPQECSVKINACKAIGLDFAGVDILFGEEGEPIVCEVNSNPHFESSFACTGVDMSELILEHIQGSLL